MIPIDPNTVANYFGNVPSGNPPDPRADLIEAAKRILENREPPPPNIMPCLYDGRRGQALVEHIDWEAEPTRTVGYGYLFPIKAEFYPRK